MNIENTPGLLLQSKRIFLHEKVPVLLGTFMVLLALGTRADAIDDLSPERTTSGGDKLFSFSDDFERPNSDVIGNTWVDCHKDKPTSFEPLAIHDNGIVISNPKTRPGIYDTTPPSAHPPTNNRIFPGIGCAWMETGANRVSVKIIWSGNHGADHPPPISHVEATPLLYISPDNPRYGFGAWTSQLWSSPILYVGYIGSPPERFEVIATGFFPSGHATGTQREVELRAEQPGKVTVWIDGKQISFSEENGLEPLVVDPTMINSTRHGFAVDAHVVDPVSNIPALKAIESIKINELD